MICRYQSITYEYDSKTRFIDRMRKFQESEAGLVWAQEKLLGNSLFFGFTLG